MSFNLTLQTLIYQALQADETLAELVEGRVYDGIPALTPTFPYVMIGEIAANEWDTGNSIGKDITVTIHTWSTYSGKRETWLIQDAIFNVLHNVQFSSDSYKISMMNEEEQRAFVDEDGSTRHGIQVYHVVMEKL